MAPRADDEAFAGPLHGSAIAPPAGQDNVEPHLAPAAKPLNALSVKLGNQVMQKLNAEVDVDKKSVDAVAKAFLTSAGLI
jgi:glycine betaine/choline ABC-type transport system substrate-binding protein